MSDDPLTSLEFAFAGISASVIDPAISTAVKPINFLRDRDARIFTAFTLSISLNRYEALLLR
jgi:hypothetical protein